MSTPKRKSASTRNILVGSVSALAFALAGASALAQEADEATTVEEIVVTAQKRAENLQDVPIAISAITAASAEAKGITQLDDLNIAIPGLNVSRTVSTGLPFIRGVGTNSSNPGVEPPVAFYVDGIYFPSSTADVASFNNIERIEVLKGPQGTLFGRNTTGGLIHIITRDPATDAFGGKARVGYGNYNTWYGNAYVGGPLGANLAADLSAYFYDQNDGWGTNVITGKDVHLRSDWGVRTKWVWRAGENTKVSFSADYSHTEDDLGSVRQVLSGLPPLPPPFAGVVIQDANIYDAQSDAPTGDSIDNWGAMFRIDHEFSGFRLASLTGYRETERETFLDLDSTPLPRSSAHYDPDLTQSFSQELQIMSPADNKVQWIAGLYFFSAEAGLHPLTIFNAALGPALFQQIEDTISTKSYAAFGQATFPMFNDRTHVTVGARYTRDEKEVVGSVRTALAVLIPNIHQEAEWENPTFRVALDHKFTDDIMGYLSLNTGFKSGIYNATAPQSPPVDPETVTSYEAGLKMEGFDRRARLNLAAFFAKYSDLQLTRFTGTTSILQNAAEAEVYGLEADGQFIVNENLSLNGTLALTHSEYTSFPNAVSFVISPVTGLGVQTIIDATGNEIMRTPNATFSLGADWHNQFSFGELGLNVTWYHNAGFFFDIDNQVAQPAYDLVNAEARWIAENERYGVKIWAKNLFDKEYFANKQTSNGNPPVGVPGAPLTFGVTLDVNF